MFKLFLVALKNDISIWTAVVIALSVIWWLKKRRDILVSRRRQSLQALKEFKESEVSESMFLAEAFLEEYFKKYISCREFAFFKKTSEPLRYIGMFLEARRYLEVTKGRKQHIAIRENKNLEKIKRIYLSVYIVFGAISILGFYGAAALFNSMSLEVVVSWLVIALSSGFLAIASLVDAASIRSALELLEELKEFVLDEREERSR